MSFVKRDYAVLWTYFSLVRVFFFNYKILKLRRFARTVQKMEFSIKDFFSKCDQPKAVNLFIESR